MISLRNSAISFLCISFALIFFPVVNVSFASSQLSSAPLISNNLPVFESDSGHNYTKTKIMQGSVPASVTFDISTLTPVQKASLLLIWYNEFQIQYDWNVYKGSVQGLPQDYIIEGSAASGGSSEPATGWTQVLAISGNTYSSRQHLLNVTGYNWLRIKVTSVIDTAAGTSAMFSLELRDASLGLQDDWIFLGDSITNAVMSHNSLDNSQAPSTLDFGKLIHASDNANLPIFENGAVGGTASIFGATNISTWLPLFPGKYVVLAFGTNDARGSISPATYYANMETMVKAVIAANKIPIIPKIPWGTYPTNSQIPLLNAQIDALRQSYPQILAGPDFYNLFLNNSNLLLDGIHPNIEGSKRMRQMWADFALTSVYKYAITPPNVTGSNITSGLIGYWKMDETNWNGTLSEILDSSSSNINGSAKNGALPTGGRFNNAATLDGINDYLDLTTNAALANIPSKGSGLSTSYWINFTGTPTGTSTLYYTLLNKQLTSAGFSQTLYWSPVDNLYRIWGNMPFSTLAADSRAFIGIAPNSWHHLVMTYSNGIVKQSKLYFDGSEIANYISQINGLGNLGDDTTAALKIGQGANGGLSFPGQIDELRIYNRPLTTQEVAELYAYNPTQPNPSSVPKVGDIDKNGKIDIFDYNQLLTDFGVTSGISLKSDIDGNGKVDIFDYNLLLTNFGK